MTQLANKGIKFYAKSKGIIQREYQDEAVLYTAYAPNPFTSMSKREIFGYKEEIADKTGQDQLGTVETTTVSILNGEKEDNDDRHPPHPRGQSERGRFPLEGLVPLADQEEEEVPNAIILVKEEEGQKGRELEEESLLLK
ncbi:adducin-related protein 1-like [Apostichopus japonicus]|uniref:adducin-related protein 1-like n=1 Tax=Stichopus japonicus TaxID=307972 RepID=UPI003AB1301B